MSNYEPRIFDDYRIYNGNDVYDKTNHFQRIIDVPLRSSIPENMRGHNRYGDMGNQHKFIWKGQFLYKPSRDGLRIV